MKKITIVFVILATFIFTDSVNAQEQEVTPDDVIEILEKVDSLKTSHLLTYIDVLLTIEDPSPKDEKTLKVSFDDLTRKKMLNKETAGELTKEINESNYTSETKEKTIKQIELNRADTEKATKKILALPLFFVGLFFTIGLMNIVASFKKNKMLTKIIILSK